MAKRKKTVVSQSPPESTEEPKIGYTVGNWAGRPQYQCKECQFDTLILDTMLEHLLSVHSVIALKEPEPFPPSPSSTDEASETPKADGIFEIDLKEDQ